ncbi:hypothetical protein [Xanthomonas euvesicatoria]|uniref:hypothetical protein n=1 Tax=Xanthomonas euvesicatoria TaxID=456327 RepID=UPI003558A42D
MKDFALCVLIAWAFAAFVSLFIIGAYYLAQPWSWICGVFLTATAVGCIAFWVAHVDG